jgi:hypothetical protein
MEHEILTSQEATTMTQHIHTVTLNGRQITRTSEHEYRFAILGGPYTEQYIQRCISRTRTERADADAYYQSKGEAIPERETIEAYEARLRAITWRVIGWSGTVENAESAAKYHRTLLKTVRHAMTFRGRAKTAPIMEMYPTRVIPVESRVPARKRDRKPVAEEVR